MAHSRFDLKDQLESLGYKCDDTVGYYPQFYYYANGKRYAAIVTTNISNDPFSVFIFDDVSIENKYGATTIDDVIHILNSKGIFPDDIPTKGVMDEGV